MSMIKKIYLGFPWAMVVALGFWFTLEAKTTVKRPPAKSSPAIAPEEISKLHARLQSAEQKIRRLPAGKTVRQKTTIDALLFESERLQNLLATNKPVCDPTPEVNRLLSALAEAQQRKFPFASGGIHRLAYRSTLDGMLHDFSLFAPAKINPGKKYPLVVMLHGMGSNHLKDLGRILGVPERELTPAKWQCDRPTVRATKDMFIVAPQGFGDAFFRLHGDVDVRAVLALVQQLYPIDPERITISGLSMGGTAALELALMHPDLFAGVFALCGYYDRFQDTNLLGQPILDWEKEFMRILSPGEWSLNGKHIPLILAHGSKDGPARAIVQKNRYQNLEYMVNLEMYPTGHDVWTKAYDNGRALSLLQPLRANFKPKDISFTTGRPRFGRAYWLEITRQFQHDRWAKIEGKFLPPKQAQITTTNVAALKVLRLQLPQTIKDDLELTIDGQELIVHPGNKKSTAIYLRRDQGKWQVVAEEERPTTSLLKRPGLSGPLEDIYYEPLVVVYGTGNGEEAKLKAVAEKLSRVAKGQNIQYPIMADRQFTSKVAQQTAAILVGNQKNNQVLARLGAKLPIQIFSDKVLLGHQTFNQPQVGAMYIYPNPEAPHRYLKIVGGTTEKFYSLLEYLPRYLPDYLVFDETMAIPITRPPTPTPPVLGAGRSFLAAGRFDEQWKISPSTAFKTPPPVPLSTTPSPGPMLGPNQAE